jgi:ribulose-5-phosphate 4-epimerase/fuculose-1-phosphate aldolase
MSQSTDPRPLMVEIAHLIYDRHLTNSAGGNISCRAGDRIYITPRRLGSIHRWRLTEEMVLVFDNDLNPILGDPSQVSRESQMHFACYQNLTEVNGVIHAHARHLSVFAAAGEPLVPTSEYTEKFGIVEVVPPLPSHSREVAEAVVAKLVPRRETLAKNGLGLILAWHGAVTVGKDLADAYDVLDRLETSAHTLLTARSVGLDLLSPAHE